MCILLRFILYSGANPKYKPPGLIFGGAYYRRFFLRFEFGGLILGGAYFRNACIKLRDKACYKIES